MSICLVTTNDGVILDAYSIPDELATENTLVELNDLAEYYCQQVKIVTPRSATTLEECEQLIRDLNFDNSDTYTGI